MADGSDLGDGGVAQDEAFGGGGAVDDELDAGGQGPPLALQADDGAPTTKRLILRYAPVAKI